LAVAVQVLFPQHQQLLAVFLLFQQLQLLAADEAVIAYQLHQA
jgi:hypothetical protein